MKTLPIANALALIVTIIINYLSNTGLFNGNTMGSVSEAYDNLFTPAGYAFSIWGLIYLGLLGFVVFTGRSLFSGKEEVPELRQIGWWFVASCVANSLWVFAWLYDHTGLSVLLMIVLLGSLLKIIVNTRMELDYHPFKKYLFVFWPFALYAGWVSIALVANISAWLTSINWSGWGLPEVSWTVVMICMAGVINIFMVLKRNLREYALVGIWGLLAVAASNDSTVIIYSCYGVSLLILGSIVLNGLRNRKRTFSSM